MNALPSSSEVLDREFLPLRGKLIEVAAALDRIQRSGGGLQDARMESIAKALKQLAEGHEKPDRAEHVQMIFSLPYDADWRRK
jgi:hypothetical protein